MRLAISFAALFLSIALVQLGSGGLGPLDALSGIARGFTTTQIGLLGSGHFVGFFIGCWLAPRLMGAIGHIRAFAAFAAVGAAGAVAHPLWFDAHFWAALRVLTGFAVAGAYTVTEVWMQAKLTNAIRGRVLGVYRMVDMGASMLAQTLVAVLEPAAYVSYNILTILCIACLLPLTLTNQTEPETPEAPRMRPMLAIRLSPLGVAGIMVSGVTSPAFRMVGPIYGTEIGLRPSEIGFYLAAAVLGGALSQIPVGWLADKFDRRWVLIGVSAAAAIVCTSIAVLAPAGNAAYAAIFAFGFVTWPVFSVSAAHANDYADAETRTDLNAAMLFLYGIGAIFAPTLASYLVALQGPAALFWLISAAHALLILFGFYRMTRRPAAAERTAYHYTPRTSFLIGRLLRRHRG
ncbi:MAG: MFS transporter [Alphaproteobacteria bacterium]|nr:MAG: MFS transporter [Alphaproteobacteria bacterium]